ncbi:MAG: NTP transferase domain-containing protein, partial [Caulobacteraceae bacterium]|nr:NTP transferase domain-containing protein [Caulobacteraceae bacterium]
MTTGAQTGRGRFAAIVLAAGAGRRFGGGKLLARFGDGVLLDGALGAAFALAPEVIVVTGTGAAAVAEAARQAHGQVGGPSRLTIVHAADHAEGMGASLRTGAKALPPDL